MNVGEIWEFDNGIAYTLCRIVRVTDDEVWAISSQSDYNNCRSAFAIRPDAEGWRLVGQATTDLTFEGKIQVG